MVNTIAEPITYFAGWTLLRIAECDSTNDFASHMEPWTAVSAQRQRQGRGRYGRTWQSDDGGAWFSAVVPAPLSDPASRLMPLAAGLAVASTFTAYGMDGVNFRWPNDVMVHGKKCAGILVDRFQSDRCVVGIGINVWNDPVRTAPELAGSAARMHDWLPDCPDPYDVTIKVLASLRKIVRETQERESAHLVEQLVPFWRVGQLVEIERAGGKETFLFCGVDTNGHVLVSNQENGPQSFSPEEIMLFREV